MSYSAYLVIGVLADYLGTGRFVAGLLLGGLLARFPSIKEGRLRIIGLLPGPARRPVIVGVFALCCMHFLSRGDDVSAGFTGFATAFVFAFPWFRRTMISRALSSVFPFAGKGPPRRTDDETVIEGEFREKKE